MIPRLGKTLKAARELKASQPALLKPAAELVEADLVSLYESAAPLAAGEGTLPGAKIQGLMMRQLHDRVRFAPPPVGTSLLLLGGWALGWIASAAGCVLYGVLLSRTFGF
jgi:hypothetical protein